MQVLYFAISLQYLIMHYSYKIKLFMELFKIIMIMLNLPELCALKNCDSEINLLTFCFPGKNLLQKPTFFNVIHSTYLDKTSG